MIQTPERKQIKNIDFNIDLAQSFGIYKNNSEFTLLEFASSVNIACGFHAGDPMTIKNALLKAKEQNVVVGAHIGFDDIQGFGYRPMTLSTDEIEALVIYQVGALMSFAKTYNMEIEHVRPHGAMYKQAATDYQFALALGRAIKKCSQWLVYYGASGDVTGSVGEELNLQVAHEVHLDKNYNTDGSIDFEQKDNENIFHSINRLKTLLATSQVDTITGGKTCVFADSIHFSNKVANAQALIQQSKDIITPVPFNYKKACLSGWVE